MGLGNQIVDYYVEIVALGIFLLTFYQMVIVLFSDSLSKLWFYIVVLAAALLLMNYKNLLHNAQKILGRRHQAS